MVRPTEEVNPFTPVTEMDDVDDELARIVSEEGVADMPKSGPRIVTVTNV